MPDDRYLTRETLLLRLRDPENQVAWEEFVRIYGPALFSHCRKRGLSYEDAADLTQEVVRSVLRAMPGFVYDPAKGSFRGWLYTLLRRGLARHFDRRSRDPLRMGETGNESVVNCLEDPAEALWEIDYRRRLLAWAMERARSRFNERIWRAFEETTLRERPIDEVAEELGMTRNALTVAKCRVLSVIRGIAARHETDWEVGKIRTRNVNS
jgi:RNA polymerase sigma-70 factor (ECF subfamily)